MADDYQDVTPPEAAPEPATNFDRLATALPEGSLAAKLLDAWRNGDAGGRTKRMLAQAQPALTGKADEPDASKD